VTDTKAALLAAAHTVVGREGIAGTSARVVAAEAGVNQALVFYHFGTVTELVAAACSEAADASVASYREELAAVGSFTELLAVGRTLHEREQASGNVAVMAQLMAGAQRDPLLAAAAQHAMEAWNREVEVAVRRVLADSPLLEITDRAGLARAIGAGFIGLELYEGVDAEGAQLALAALEQLGAVAEILDDLGPVARRAVRARLRRTSRST
jgi:AcrR family transcriptional regulator